MTLLAIVAVAMAAILTWRLTRGAMWRAADRALAERFALGSDGSIPGAHEIFRGGHPRAVLLLHGFGDTPQSLEPLASRLADAGWTVSVPLLAGHGRTLAEFHASRAAQWIDTARRAYAELSRQHAPVVVCGQSMGAALALDLAASRSVPALALLAPYISMPVAARVVAVLWPIAQVLQPVIGTRHARSIHDPDAAARSLAFGYATPRLLSQLWGVVKGAQRDLRRVRTATLIVHSREDNRVPPRNVVRAASRISHPVKALQWVSGCGHVMTVDYCQETVAAHVIDWFERCTVPQRAATPTR